MSNHTPTDNNPEPSLPLEVIPDQFKDEQGPVFAEPWQADVFAITVSLHQQGMFTWQEWADALSQSIARAHNSGDPDLGDTYYHHWLDALEHMVESRNPGARLRLADLYQQWDEAARSTPHGQPVELLCR